ncbi:MAG: hypothetical protein COA33_003640 [Fluviicola sp.]|nr:hypothetical protein [Fluviicola sp.]
MQNISRTYRFITLSLAFIMLFTTTGFSMDIHFCEGKIAQVSFFSKADACEMEKKVTVEHECCANNAKQISKSNNGQESIDNERCCFNETVVLSSTNDFSEADETSLSHSQLTFITAFVLSSYNLFFAEEKVPNFSHYSPPLINEDISVLHQVFII